MRRRRSLYLQCRCGCGGLIIWRCGGGGYENAEDPRSRMRRLISDTSLIHIFWRCTTQATLFNGPHMGNTCHGGQHMSNLSAIWAPCVPYKEKPWLWHAHISPIYWTDQYYIMGSTLLIYMGNRLFIHIIPIHYLCHLLPMCFTDNITIIG